MRKKLAIASAISGIVAFVGFMAWLEYHGYFISPDGIYLNVLAKSFWSHPYLIWFKRAYSYKYEIIHHDFTFPPLGPMAHWFLGAIGVTTWHRGNWITAFFMGMTIPAWAWAMEPHFAAKSPYNAFPKVKRKWWVPLLAGWIAMAVLLAMAQNQMWHELFLGIVSPIAVFLFVLSYGAYVRGRYILCGVITGLAFLVRFDAQVTLAILVLGHCLAHPERKRWRKTARECLQMGLAFLAVTSPWWIRALALGFPPWFNHMVPIFLYGEAGNFRWFPDTDTALGHPINNLRPFFFYEDLVTQRWFDLINPYFGVYVAEMMVPPVLVFLGVMYGLRRPAHRALVAFVWIGAFLRIAVVAGLYDAFNRRYFLIFDACAITWITLMLWDKNLWIRNASRLVIVLLVLANWDALTLVLKTMRPYVGYLEAGTPAISQAIAQLDQTREPVLTGQILGHGVAYYTDQIPVIELPTNYADEGMMDQYLDRWKIRWTTEAGTISKYVTHHRFVDVTAPNGMHLSRVEGTWPAPAAH